MSVPDMTALRPSKLNVGAPGEGYCTAWGCESTGWIDRQPPVTGTSSPSRGREIQRQWAWELALWAPNGLTVAPIMIKSGSPTILGPPLWGGEGPCNTLVMSFSEAGKRADWTTGRTRGLRLYRSGYDLCTVSPTLY